MFIPLGPNCHPAGNLVSLGLRHEALPFDWLAVKNNKVFEYVNSLIDTEFRHFTEDLVYNTQKIVVSANYDYVQFFHHDLIKNTNFKRPEDDGKDLKATMNRRGVRFMDIIRDTGSDVVFLHRLCYTDLFINGRLNTKLYEDMVCFDSNPNIACKFKVLAYLYTDNEDCETVLPKELSTLKHFIFEHYTFNRTANSVYGCQKDFETMLKKQNLI